MDVQNPLSYILRGYVDDFRNHQEAVKARLRGTLSDEPPLLPAFIPPASYWTSAEKDLFFHGLTLYSRLQPELIARHIATKTTFDVCLFLDVLNRAAEFDEDEDEIGEEYHGIELFEPAIEVSDRWIEREEAIAASLVELDTCPGSFVGSRDDRKCRCPSTSRLYDRGEEEEFVEDRSLVHLNHLDSTCLMILENIIRAAEHEGNNSEQNVPPTLEEDQVSDPPSEGPEPPVQNDTQAVSNSAKTSTDLRRLQKRLYMRRKRAEASGKTANLDLRRLRPGRETKVRKPSKPRPKNYSQSRKKALSGGRPPQAESRGSSNKAGDNEHPSPTHEPEPDFGGDKDANPVHEEPMYEGHSQGGLRRPYKVKKLFLESGINAAKISSMELDFFYLSRMAKLLGACDSLQDVKNISISADCVQFLREIVKEFVSAIIQRAIVMKEQEVRLKGKLKVWKYHSEEISAANVLDCMKTMGLDLLNGHFDEVLGNSDTEDDSASTISDPDNSTVEPECSLSPHFISQDTKQEYPAPQFPPPSLAYLPNLSYFDLFSDNDNLPSDIDEAALNEELDEEEILDAQDMERCRMYERSLWRSHR